jgi:hypothetical protein
MEPMELGYTPKGCCTCIKISAARSSHQPGPLRTAAVAVGSTEKSDLCDSTPTQRESAKVRHSYMLHVVFESLAYYLWLNRANIDLPLLCVHNSLTQRVGSYTIRSYHRQGKPAEDVIRGEYLTTVGLTRDYPMQYYLDVTIGIPAASDRLRIRMRLKITFIFSHKRYEHTHVCMKWGRVITHLHCTPNCWDKDLLGAIPVSNPPSHATAAHYLIV